MLFFVSLTIVNWLHPQRAVSPFRLIVGICAWKLADQSIHLCLSSLLLSRLPISRQATINTYCHMTSNVGLIVGPVIAANVYTTFQPWNILTFSIGFLALGTGQHI